MKNDTPSRPAEIKIEFSFQAINEEFVNMLRERSNKIPHFPFNRFHGAGIRNRERKRVFEIKRFNNRLKRLDKLKRFRMI